MVKLSPHFKLSEFTKSYYVTTTFPNIPTASALICLTHLCINVLEPLRDKIGKPLIINSGFRIKEINDKVGGVRNSQHLLGQACDIRYDKPQELIDIIVNCRIPFDQLIKYDNMVHVSYNPFDKQRYQCFSNISKD